MFHAEDEYLINHPAFSQKSGRLVWPAYTGRLYQFDLSSGEARQLKTVEALTDEERAQGWAPGGWQQVAYHRASDRVFLLVDQRDKWRHKTASRFVVVLNASTGERLAKLEMGHEIDSVAVSQDEKPLLNNEAMPHNIAFKAGVFTDAKFEGDMMKKNTAFTLRFNEPGSYDYHCTPHPFMKGKVIVE